MDLEVEPVIEKAIDSRDGVLGTTDILWAALGVLSMAMQRCIEVVLVVKLWFDACLKSDDRLGLSTLGRAAMVAREVGAFLIAADGLVNTLGSLFTDAFEGELPGLGSGKRDK